MKRYNICIVRPQGYIWSSIFFELAELLSFSIADLGYIVNITENFLIDDGVNIIIGGHLIGAKGLEQIPKNSIIFNTEQIGSGPQRWNQHILHLCGKFEMWDFSKRNIINFHEMGLPLPHFFKFGYHRKLERIPKTANKDIDILFYGSMNENREKIIRQLRNRNLNVMTIFGKFATDRDFYISRSKIVLNMHQHATKDFEIIRAHYLMNNGKVIVSQVDQDTHIEPEYAEGLLASNYHNLVDSCSSLLQNKSKMDALESLSLDAIKKTDSVQIVRSLLSIHDLRPVN